MDDAYLGEVRLVGFNFAPVGWALCQGQLLSISEYDALFTLLGTTYGGDGMNTFGLPDLRGRSPIHMGSASGTPYVAGQTGGSEAVTLNSGQIPAHTHSIPATNSNGQSNSPAGQTFAGTASLGQYEAAVAPVSGTIVGPSTGGQPHNNLMPYLTANYIIALVGIYPSQG